MDKTFVCCKCGKEDEAPYEVAAWDGQGNEACYPCFGKWGWRVFGEDFSPNIWGRAGVR